MTLLQEVEDLLNNQMTLGLRQLIKSLEEEAARGDAQGHFERVFALISEAKQKAKIEHVDLLRCLKDDRVRRHICMVEATLGVVGPYFREIKNSSYGLDSDQLFDHFEPQIAFSQNIMTCLCELITTTNKEWGTIYETIQSFRTQRKAGKGGRGVSIHKNWQPWEFEKAFQEIIGRSPSRRRARSAKDTPMVDERNGKTQDEATGHGGRAIRRDADPKKNSEAGYYSIEETPGVEEPESWSDGDSTKVSGDYFATDAGGSNTFPLDPRRVDLHRPHKRQRIGYNDVESTNTVVERPRNQLRNVPGRDALVGLHPNDESYSEVPFNLSDSEPDQQIASKIIPPTRPPSASDTSRRGPSIGSAEGLGAPNGSMAGNWQVTNAGEAQMSPSVFDLLRPGCLLNDDIMNVVLRTFLPEEVRLITMPSLPMDPELWRLNVSYTWKPQQRKACFPLYVPGHWILIFFNVEKCEATVYDPLHDRNMVEGMKRLAVKLVVAIGHDWTSQGWTVEELKGPRQNSHTDCGVYVVAAALHQACSLPMPTTFHVSHWRILLHLALSDSKLTLAYVKDFCRSSVAKEQRAAPGNQLGQSPSSYLVEMQKVFNGICSFDRMAPKETEERLGIVLSKLTEARGHFEEALNVRHISEDIDERSRPNLTKLFPTGELESLVHKLSAQIQHVKARMHNRKARERGCHAAYELQQFMDAAAADLRRAKEDQERQNREAEAARHQVDIMVDQSRKRYREKQDFALVLGL